MGSYGFGPARAAAAAVEQFADRARDLVAAVDGAVRCRGGRARQGGQRGARAGRPALRRAPGARAAHAVRRPRCRPGREVRRRGAARRPGAGDGRAPDARQPARSRSRSAAAASRGRSRWRARPRRSPRSGRRSPEGPSGEPSDHQAPAVRDRPLRAAAAADALHAAAEPVDDPECDRVHPARADPGVPGGRVLKR